MLSFTKIFRRGYRVVRDSELIQILNSEIKYEQSTDQFKGHTVGSLGNFELSWDGKRSKDVVLKRKCDSGEEIALSAKLGYGNFVELGENSNSLPFEALMKICIKKPELRSLLQFDCVIENKGYGLSDFSISRVCYLPSSSCLENEVYRGPLFSDLDPQLQAMYKEYLMDKGIGEDLTNFLILHLHKKEKDQYVNWLARLEATLSKPPS
ncbi:hypothetical protein AQUCO_00900308v1 [Aquilegia coerulea]|uniref:Mitochondrial glycoprotein n=1 Tax=Aquilegia coerulea TaxID=218851 RepID=A0A2G5ECZ8_AQUCA|nr:hypothetical protein AQUCO_00900308v1 [Aquilegia coerulea]